jgi:hypothetical protein
MLNAQLIAYMVTAISEKVVRSKVETMENRASLSVRIMAFTVQGPAKSCPTD